MAKKDEIRRDFNGTVGQAYNSLNKGFYRAHDEENDKVKLQVIHEENLMIIKMLSALIEEYPDIAEKFLRKDI